MDVSNWMFTIYSKLIDQQPDVAESWPVLQTKQQPCCASWTEVCYLSKKQKGDEGLCPYPHANKLSAGGFGKETKYH